MKISFFIIMSLLSFHLFASVKPVYTRHVIGVSGEYKVDIVNTSNNNYLVQSWLESLEGQTSSLPIILTPPIFEIGSQGEGFVRLTPLTDKLNTRNEQVFWLNIQEIPQKHNMGENTNVLRMAVRSRIKIFVRPEGLDSDGLLQAAKNLVFTVVDISDQKFLQAYNSSPYYLSMGHLGFLAGDNIEQLEDRFNMVPPFGYQLYKLPRGLKDPILKVSHGIIDDYGGINKIYKTSVNNNGNRLP